jgi:hypothetical protein
MDVENLKQRVTMLSTYPGKGEESHIQGLMLWWELMIYFAIRNKVHHHAGSSLLETLPIDMIETFCIDPMHLVHMRAMLKLLFILVHNRRIMKVKLSWQMMKEVSDILVQIKKFISVEFHRKTWKLDELSRFKAT